MKVVVSVEAEMGKIIRNPKPECNERLLAELNYLSSYGPITVLGMKILVCFKLKQI